MNVWNDPSSGNGGLDERVEFFVTANGQLQMPRRDALDLEILAGIAGQFQDFGRQVLENGRRVHGGRSTHAVALLDGLFQEAVDATYRELQTGFGRT